MRTELAMRYQQFIQTNRLKSSRRRDLIFENIVQTSNHFTVDQIYQQMLAIDPGIGIATVYRTIRLLVDCGILMEHTFGEKRGFFEVIATEHQHHDHLICTHCGRIFEFHSPTIEMDQQRVAQQYQFKIENHKLEIYGICQQCQQQQISKNLMRTDH